MVRRGFVVAVILLLCQLPASAQLFELFDLYATQPEPQKVRPADLDGLPGIDLITANLSGGLSLLVNGSFGAYLPPVHVDVFGSWNVNDVAAADLDGDLDVDLVAVTPFRVVFLRNDGHLEFTEIGFHEPGQGVLGRVETADLDGDGDQDVILGSEGLGGVRVMENAGDGTFSGSTLIFGIASVDDVVVADLDNDAILDLAAIWQGYMVVLMGRGDGTFDDEVLYDEPPGMTRGSISAGLMNDDAFVDLVTLPMDAFFNGHTLIWTNNGDGAFGAPIEVSSEYLARKTVVAEIDQQPCPDLVSTGYQIASYWLNDCDGGWSYGWINDYALPEHVDIAAVDVDSDTDLDVVMLLQGINGVAVFENTVIESPGIFGDRFETGDTSRWSSTVP